VTPLDRIAAATRERLALDRLPLPPRLLAVRVQRDLGLDTLPHGAIALVAELVEEKMKNIQPLPVPERPPVVLAVEAAYRRCAYRARPVPWRIGKASLEARVINRELPPTTAAYWPRVDTEGWDVQPGRTWAVAPRIEIFVRSDWQERVEGEGLAVLDGHLTLFAERIRGGDGWKAIRIVQDENLALTTQPININIDKHGDLAIETFWKENTTC
jgi:hypothetical protein